MHNLIYCLGWLLSPTRKIIDLLKVRGSPAYRGKALRFWSRVLFYLELTGCAVTMVLFAGEPLTELSLVGGVLLVYAYSRIIEIAYAFYRDPLSKSKKSDLKVKDRICMAMRSYFGLAFNFAVLYYFLPITKLFKVDEQYHLNSFFESFYFSSVTLATLGYGDIVPIHWVSSFAFYL